MKVAHVNAGNEYGGGLVHIVSLLKELKDKNCELIVLEEGPVAKAARQEGITVHVFQQVNRYDLSVVVKLINFLKKGDYTHIHTHGPRANSLAYFMRHFIEVKWVTTIHSNPSLDFMDNGLKGRLFEKINKRAITKSHGVIAVSDEIKVSVKSLGVPDERIQVIPNGITFSNPLLLEKETHTFTILTIGRLHPIKGYNLLVQALGELPITDWRWIVCGEGQEELKLKCLCKDWKIESRVSFLGWMPSEDVKEVASQADILVHPSLSESFPLVLLEAAEQQLPAIATDVGDVKKIINDDTMGWLIQPNNLDELKNAILEAFNLWEEKQLKKKGIAFHGWAQQFSLTRQAKKVFDFYKNTMT